MPRYQTLSRSMCRMKMASSALSMALENRMSGKSADRHARSEPVTRAHVVSNVSLWKMSVSTHVDKVKIGITKMGPFEKEYRAEDDDDVPTTSGKNKAFFETVDGVTYHANSFLDLYLSRLLLRACEALGYCKLTLIQTVPLLYQL